MAFEALLLLISCLVMLSAVLSRASNNLGVPTILLFLGVGVGAAVTGVEFSNLLFAQHAGIIALVIILFSGGLDTQWKIVRPVFWPALSLSTLGVIATAALVALFAGYVLGLSVEESLLLGAILASTDAAALFALLRSRGIALKGKLTPLLEFESGTNDPMAVFLTVALIGMIQSGNGSLTEIAQLFISQMVVGTLIGLVCGRALLGILNHLKSPVDGIYPVVALSGALLTYSLAAAFHGSGFLAVYLAGLVLGSNEFIHKRSVMRFLDGSAWLSQIMMFILLGLLISPTSLLASAGVGAALTLFLIFVARPLAVELSLLGGRFSFRERALISWVGLRGAVPIILALFPLIAGVPRAQEIFNLVFFIVVGSALLQGWSIAGIAQWLGLNAEKPRREIEELLPGLEGSPMRVLELTVPSDSPVAGKPLVELSFPGSALVVLITRGAEFVVPRGSTELLPGDKLQLLCEASSDAAQRSYLGVPR